MAEIIRTSTLVMYYKKCNTLHDIMHVYIYISILSDMSIDILL